MSKAKFQRSKVLYENAREYLVNGVGSSFHKTAIEEFPIYIDHGKGSKLYDVDGNEYIDYVLGLGPMILGYCNKDINSAVLKQLEKGSHYAAPTLELTELSKKITEVVPCAEKVVFQSTGTEAVMYSFRLARAYTGKEKMIKFEGHYHGWADEQNISFVADSAKYLGPRNNPWKLYNVPGQRQAAADDVIMAPWNDLEILEEIILRNHNNIAGMIMEPYMLDEGPIMPKSGYLDGVRKLADKYNIILIFDEIFTGFRLALGGAQEYFGVLPDVALYAKSLAGGFPMSVICGKKEILQESVTFSGCFNGNPIATASALVVLSELEKEGVYTRFQELGDKLSDGLIALGKKHNIKLFSTAAGSVVTLVFGVERPCNDVRDYIENADIAYYNKVFMAVRKHGVRLCYRRGRMLLSTAHTEEDIERTLAAFDLTFSELL